MKPRGHVDRRNQVRVGEVVERYTRGELVDTTENEIAIFQQSQTYGRRCPTFARDEFEWLRGGDLADPRCKCSGLVGADHRGSRAEHAVQVQLLNNVAVPQVDLSDAHGSNRSEYYASRAARTNNPDPQILQNATACRSPKTSRSIHHGRIRMVRPTRVAGLEELDLRANNSHDTNSLCHWTDASVPPKTAINARALCAKYDASGQCLRSIKCDRGE